MNENYSMNDIPLDNFINLFCNLDIEEIINICKINKNYNNICKNEALWISLLERDFNYKLNDNNKSAFESYIGIYNSDYGKLVRYTTSINKNNFFKILKLTDNFIYGNILKLRPENIKNFLDVYNMLLNNIIDYIPEINQNKLPIANHIISLGEKHYDNFIRNMTREITDNYDLYMKNIIVNTNRDFDFDTNPNMQKIVVFKTKSIVDLEYLKLSINREIRMNH